MYTTLREAGIDIDALLERVLHKEALIRRFMQKYVDDTNFTTLQESIAADNRDAALTASHNLKGMSGNLSITLLYELFGKQVQLFRDGDWEQACSLMHDITLHYERITTAIRKWLAE